MSHDANGLTTTWRDTPPDVDDRTVAVIVEALLPLGWCPDVVVRRAFEQKLSVIERFLIEVALELGDLASEDLDELIGLPAEATERIAGHLCEMRVLAQDGGSYRVLSDAAHAALAREVLVEHRPQHLIFLVLPKTGDVLAYEHKSGRRTPPMIERLRPAGRAPAPEPFRSTPLPDVLNASLGEQRVAGLPQGVVDVVSVGPVSWLDECPVYRCTGRLTRRPSGIEARIELYGEGDESTHRLDVSGAGAIVDHWLAQAERSSALEVVLAASDEIGLAPRLDGQMVHRTAPAEWTFALSVDEARQVADKGRSLNDGGALEITSPDGTTNTAVVVRFSPAEPAAVAVFAGEDLVDRLEDRGDAVTAEAVTELAAATSAAFGLHDEALHDHGVRERLWQRGRHDVVYRLRAAEDFAYG